MQRSDFVKRRVIIRSFHTAELVRVFYNSIKRRQEYPDFGAPYDSLAKAYMLNERNGLALKNYKKALELDPNNSNVKMMLNKIEKK